MDSNSSRNNNLRSDFTGFNNHPSNFHLQGRIHSSNINYNDRNAPYNCTNNFTAINDILPSPYENSSTSDASHIGHVNAQILNQNLPLPTNDITRMLMLFNHQVVLKSSVLTFLATKLSSYLFL